MTRPADHGAAVRRRRFPRLEVAVALAALATGVAVAGAEDASVPPAAQDVPDHGSEGRAAVDEVPVAAGLPAVSDDGQRVAFVSRIGTLVPGDANGSDDVFVLERTTGTVTLASRGAAGAPVGSVLGPASISGDGRYVTFTTAAPSVVPGDDPDGVPDVFRRDLVAGSTVRVSVPAAGSSLDSPVGAWATRHATSDDGRFVVFESGASNLVAGDANGSSDVFVRDVAAGATTRLSTDAGGADADGDAFTAAISGDGTTVAFATTATDVVAGDTNGVADVVVRPRAGGAAERASVRSNGAQGNGESLRPSLSDDGVVVAFETRATDLASGTDANGATDIVVRHRTNGTTTRLSASSGGITAGNGPSTEPTVSGDGSVVVFLSDASSISSGDLNGRTDVFARAVTGSLTTERLSKPSGNQSGLLANAVSGAVAVTDDGSEAVFASAASNLVVGDENQAVDLFVRDRATHVTSVLAVAPEDPAGNLVVDGSFEPPGLPVAQSVFGGYTTIGRPSHTTAGAWDVVAGGVDVVGTNSGTAGDRLQYVDLNGNGHNDAGPTTVLSQRLETTPGRRYRLSFLLAGNPNDVPVVKDVRVRFGGLTRDASFDTTGRTNHDLGWEEVALSLDACSNATDLRFETRTTGDRGPLVDRVRVVDVGPAQVPCCVAPGPFDDVPATHPFCTDVAWLVDRGVAQGYGDGTYRPTAPITRQAMAAFLSRSQGGAVARPACTAPPFPDVPVTHRFCPEIRWMATAGISGGYPDGTFRPSAPISRQAMAAFLRRALEDEPAAACTSAPFSDVGVGHAFCAEVRWMVQAGITSGYEDGSFRPTAAVSRQAMAAFLRRAMA